MLQVFVLYNCAETLVLGIFDSLESLRLAGKKYGEDHDFDLNLDLVGYKVKMGEICPIGIDDKNIVTL